MRRWLIRIAVSLAVLAIGLPVASLLVLRWVPPLTSARMLQERTGALFTRGDGLQLQYRWTGWDAIAPEARLAVVAAEDQNFPRHSGFDREAIADALEAHEHGRRLRGASTISQQVAKNLFLWPRRSFLRKGLEAYFTVLIEALWPKRRILEVYLNIAEMGPGVYGVGAASRLYFDKPAAALTPREASLLAAVLPSPKRMHAERPSAYVRRRAAWIRGQMEQLGGPSYLREL
jgi:monofunctional biosynthetic peptidoglycan transglycosylase